MRSLDGLRCDSVDAKPLIFDFSEHEPETRWDIVYPDISDWSREELEAWAEDHDVNRPSALDWAKADEDEQEQMLDELREDVFRHMQDEPDLFAPMMNYIYPLPYYRGSASDAQSVLTQVGVSVVVVEVDGDVYLALSGGGMDMSWDICRAYMELGYLPPFHFSDLPRFAGMEWSEENAWVLAGCLKSAEILRGWATRRAKSLQEHFLHLATEHVGRTMEDVPEDMPLPILADWLQDQDREEEAARVRELLATTQGVSQ